MSKKNFGNPISIAWDNIDDIDYIVLREVNRKDNEKPIMAIEKYFWDRLDPETRDTILTKARECYG